MGDTRGIYGNICLTGYMGSGKTTVGRLLAKRTGRDFADTDEMIVRLQERSIPDIFRDEGEGYFRRCEKELLRKLLEEGIHDTVLSTGGGIVVNEENHELLSGLGEVIYLRACPETLYERLKGDNTRPLLASGDLYEKIRTMLTQRGPLYEKSCSRIIDTDDLDADGVVLAILGKHI